jgi:poly(ADP-ribose) glycohydrolase ARH3
MPISADRAVGCLLGLALGDALGAPHEGGLLERSLWRLIGRTRAGEARFTDDTQMALDLAASLLAGDALDADDFARRLAASYRWSRGYGRGMTRVLRRIRGGRAWAAAARAVYADGSFGNGAAVRAPVLALWARDEPELLELARASAVVTHAHPLGIDGARLLAATTRALALGAGAERALAVALELDVGAPLAAPLQRVAAWARAGASPPPREVVAQLGHGMTVPTSCATALHLALRHLHRPFAELLEFARACGGDVDTIGAMAGALWGAANGAAQLPATRFEQRDELAQVALALAARGHARAVPSY